MKCDCCGSEIGWSKEDSRVDRVIEDIGGELCTTREIHGNFCAMCRNMINAAIEHHDPFLDRVCSKVKNNQRLQNRPAVPMNLERDINKDYIT